MRNKFRATVVLVVVLLAILVLGCAEINVPTATVVVESARVRSGPGTNFLVVNGVKYGCPVWVHAKSFSHDGTWYNVSTFCDNGWIRGDLLSMVVENIPVVDSPSTPVPPTTDKNHNREGTQSNGG